MNRADSYIRSFVLRQGRITPGQRKALEKHWPEFGVDFNQQLLDIDQLFGRQAPKILDIGTGTGDSTIALARAHPENDYLAVEVHTPGIGSLLRKIAEHNLRNIRIFNHDVIEVLRWQIPPRSLDNIYLFFPDPWPKKRHHKRRLINTEFLPLAGRCMQRHARLFIATDWEDYAEHIKEVFKQVPDFVNLAGEDCPAPRPHWRITTRFEQRGKKLDHSVTDFVFSYQPRAAAKCPGNFQSP